MEVLQCYVIQIDPEVETGFLTFSNAKSLGGDMKTRTHIFKKNDVSVFLQKQSPVAFLFKGQAETRSSEIEIQMMSLPRDEDKAKATLVSTVKISLAEHFDELLNDHEVEIPIAIGSSSAVLKFIIISGGNDQSLNDSLNVDVVAATIHHQGDDSHKHGIFFQAAAASGGFVVTDVADSAGMVIWNQKLSLLVPRLSSGSRSSSESQVSLWLAEEPRIFANGDVDISEFDYDTDVLTDVHSTDTRTLCLLSHPRNLRAAFIACAQKSASHFVEVEIVIAEGSSSLPIVAAASLSGAPQELKALPVELSGDPYSIASDSSVSFRLFLVVPNTGSIATSRTVVLPTSSIENALTVSIFKVDNPSAEAEPFSFSLLAKHSVTLLDVTTTEAVVGPSKSHTKYFELVSPFQMPSEAGEVEARLYVRIFSLADALNAVADVNPDALPPDAAQPTLTDLFRVARTGMMSSETPPSMAVRFDLAHNKAGNPAMKKLKLALSAVKPSGFMSAPQTTRRVDEDKNREEMAKLVAERDSFLSAKNATLVAEIHALTFQRGIDEAGTGGKAAYHRRFS